MLKKYFLWLIPGILLGLLSFSFIHQYQAQVPTSKYHVLKQVLIKSLQGYHFAKLPLDDSLSARSYRQYLERIDPNKRFYIQADIDELQQYSLLIDDELNGAEMPLLERSIALMDTRSAQVEQYVNEILSAPLNYSTNRSIELDGEKRQYAKNEKELKQVWKDYIQYQANVRYQQKLKEQEDKEKKALSENEKFSKMTSAEIDSLIRAEVAKSLERRFDVLKKLDEEDRTAEYLNAIASVFDPHTEFYPPQEKENFDIQMSGSLEGIGASLTQQDGETKVAQIVPGSPSWRSEQLEENDVILKVAQAGEEPVSITDMPLKDAVSLIRGPKGTEVTLTLRKSDNRITSLTLVRDKIVLEESYAKSAIINDAESGLKVGVINLPSFYANFNNDPNGRSSAEDVRAEVIKLKAQDVDGIVLDLRNNGGGSLADAVDMSGLFIEKGPIVQVKDSYGRKNVLSDSDADVVWDGPLAIMVNRFSASASEILAAAMQDYNRAVVIGTPSSFGKGTVQRFIDLDPIIPAYFTSLKPFGSVKLTIQKFYRINGDATQIKGVVPDVWLPDSYNYLTFGEGSLDYVLPFDEIQKANYRTWNGKVDALRPYLAERSRERVGQSAVFSRIEENALRLKEQQENTELTLNLDEYIAMQEKLTEQAKQFETLTSADENLEVNVLTDPTITDEKIADARQKSANNWGKQLQKDVYLQEAIDVMNDLIETDPATLAGPTKRKLKK